jgi:hypothetical protein
VGHPAGLIYQYVNVIHDGHALGEIGDTVRYIQGYLGRRKSVNFEGHGPWIHLMIDPEKCNENFEDSFIMYPVSVLHFSRTQNATRMRMPWWVCVGVPF